MPRRLSRSAISAYVAAIGESQVVVPVNPFVLWAKTAMTTLHTRLRGHVQQSHHKHEPKAKEDKPNESLVLRSHVFVNYGHKNHRRNQILGHAAISVSLTKATSGA
jgi:hypothetical protein